MSTSHKHSRCRLCRHPARVGAYEQIDLGVPKTGVAGRGPLRPGCIEPAAEKLDVPFD
ncbi:hypothetical protein [Nesterenkonia jeotgali]|uniref:Uncharacterized protein n=1 Tax=Nesterenkonia jeotgali TaxID=317018 RepID=A0A839FN83_9MICC|nr:hypothetical protein [Nesterenkonia jeotgali]MBA8921366.1 hypothetical protein [Nesterenkonia jeotgali]